MGRRDRRRQGTRIAGRHHGRRRDRRHAGHHRHLPGSRVLVAGRDPGPCAPLQLLDRCGAPLRARRRLRHTVEHIERITALIVEICGTPTPRSARSTTRSSTCRSASRSRLRTARAHQGDRRGDRPTTPSPTSSPASACRSRARAGPVTVTAPSYRFDIEIEEDLIEEVARVYGFENIPALPPVAPSRDADRAGKHPLAVRIRHQLADLGYQEVVNMSFVESAVGSGLRRQPGRRSACRTRSPAR
jgi:hypothetical protein